MRYLLSSLIGFSLIVLPPSTYADQESLAKQHYVQIKALKTMKALVDKLKTYIPAEQYAFLDSKVDLKAPAPKFSYRDGELVIESNRKLMFLKVIDPYKTVLLINKKPLEVDLTKPFNEVWNTLEEHLKKQFTAVHFIPQAHAITGAEIFLYAGAVAIATYLYMHACDGEFSLELAPIRGSCEKFCADLAAQSSPTPEELKKISSELESHFAEVTRKKGYLAKVCRKELDIKETEDCLNRLAKLLQDKGQAPTVEKTQNSAVTK